MSVNSCTKVMTDGEKTLNVLVKMQMMTWANWHLLWECLFTLNILSLQVPLMHCLD